MWSLQKLNRTLRTIFTIYMEGHLLPPLSEPPALTSWTEVTSMTSLVEIPTDNFVVAFMNA